jgi:hypothetical protein
MKAIFAAIVTVALALAAPALAQDKLVAIDVLLEPDQRMLDAAGQWNERLREQDPTGFSLDETHRPHITLLQQYVAEKDLDAVVAAAKSLAAPEDLGRMRLTATGLYHIPSGKLGLQGITIKPSDEILALQAKVIEAMAPFRNGNGSSRVGRGTREGAVRAVRIRCQQARCL